VNPFNRVQDSYCGYCFLSTTFLKYSIHPASLYAFFVPLGMDNIADDLTKGPVILFARGGLFQ
jgi:hypothetical protein